MLYLMVRSSMYLDLRSWPGALVVILLVSLLLHILLTVRLVTSYSLSPIKVIMLHDKKTMY